MQVAKWGNSLAIRLPATVVEALDLKPGDDIDIHIHGERSFAVEKAPSPQALLARLRTFRAVCPPISSSTGWMPMSGVESAPGRAFFDTNVLLYLLAGDAAKADRAEALLANGGVISVQVLNEFASVASRKLRMPWAEVREVLATVSALCSVEPLTIDTHQRALALAERYGLSFYDASIAAAALLAGCQTLQTEDLQHGQVIEQRLTIRNPFALS